MFNIRKLTLIGFCSLIVFGLGACSNSEVVERKKAWYPPSATPDASATPTVDASPVVGPDPANPHLIPRPFVNADGSFNRPVEPDLTDHSEQGVLDAAVFIMQMREFYSVTGDPAELEKYISPDSFTGQRLIDSGENLVAIATATGSVACELDDVEVEVEYMFDEDGISAVTGKAKYYYDLEKKYHDFTFLVGFYVDPATNNWMVYEMKAMQDES